MSAQLPIDGLALDPTPAMVAGESYVTQCAWCGLLACVVGGIEKPAPKTIGACPACGRTEWWRQELPVGPFHTLDSLNAELDWALKQRVKLHRDREDRKISVRDYLDGLAAVREVEDRLEPLRRQLGATSSRAMELTMAEREEAA